VKRIVGYEDKISRWFYWRVTCAILRTCGRRFRGRTPAVSTLRFKGRVVKSYMLMEGIQSTLSGVEVEGRGEATSALVEVERVL